MRRHQACRVSSVGKDKGQEFEGTPYGCGHNGRRRHACSHGTALRHRRGYSIQRRRSSNIGSDSLRIVSKDGSGARSFRHIRRRTREEQSLPAAHKGGRPSALQRHNDLRTSQHCMSHHSSYRHNIAHDTDHKWHRTGIHARIQAPSQGKSQRCRRTC